MRRRADPDYLELRLGVADRPSPIQVSDRSRKETDEPPEPDTLGDVPVSLSMRDLGVIGICGEGGGVDALARWLVGTGRGAARSAATWTSSSSPTPSVSSSGAGPAGCRTAGVLASRSPPYSARSSSPSARRLAELSQLIADRSPEDRRVGLPGGITPRPDVLVVVDGARRLRALPGLVTLLREGPGGRRHGDLPRRGRAAAAGGVPRRPRRARGPGRAAAYRFRGRRPDPSRPGRSPAGRPASDARSLRCATPRRPSRCRDFRRRPGCWSASTLEHPTPEGVAAPVGAGRRAPTSSSARASTARSGSTSAGTGPHALIAGTTGSGKSELLQTLVASLAVANRPEQLTFVLVDYKGGSAFKDCARLPHTVGMVTDLDTHLVSRALTSLGAELKRREHLLAVPGAKDLEDYWALQRRDPDAADDPAAGDRDRRVRQPQGRAARLRDRPGDDRPARPVARDPPGARHPAAVRRDLQRHPGQHQPADRAPGDRRQRVQGRHRRRRRPRRSVPTSRVAATPGSATRHCCRSRPVGSAVPGPDADAGRGHRARATDRLAGRLGGRRAPGAEPAEGRRAGRPTRARPTSPCWSRRSPVRPSCAGIGAQHSPWLPELPAPVTLATLRDLVDDQTRHRPGAPAGPRPGCSRTTRPTRRSVRATFTLGKSGHLYIVGGARSGRSTALRTIAVGLAEVTRSRDLHLYGLDCGNGALLPLDRAPADRCGRPAHRGRAGEPAARAAR